MRDLTDAPDKRGPPIKLKLTEPESALLQRAVSNHVKLLRYLSGQKGLQSYRDRQAEACRTLEALQARLFPPEAGQ